MTYPRTIAIIQARMSSSRLPGKVLLDLGGQPALAWVIQRARRARLLSAQRAVIDAFARARCNTEIDALVETTPYPTGGYARARSGREAPEVDGCIRIRQAPANLKAGDFIRVRITGQAGCDLTAVPA